MPCQVFLDLTMPGHRLTGPAPGVLIPIVTPAVPDENTSVLFYLTDEIDSFHAIRSFETFRTPGICPLVNSS